MGSVVIITIKQGYTDNKFGVLLAWLSHKQIEACVYFRGVECYILERPNYGYMIQVVDKDTHNILAKILVETYKNIGYEIMQWCREYMTDIEGDFPVGEFEIEIL